MKKTVISLIAVCLLVSALQAVFLYGNTPFGLFGETQPATVPFYSEAGRIRRSGEAAPFLIRGVLMDSCLPGHYSTDFAVEEAQYYTWLTQIAAMGANTVSVYSLMDPDFYNALYRYNTGAQEPLYLIQGISAPDYNMNNAQDAWGGFYDKLLSDAKDTVDAVHGNKIVSLGRVRSSGNYIRNVSPWTIGYLLGSEWAPYTLAYTDNKADNPTAYEGSYFKASGEASKTEVMFARLMDEIVAYETHRYGAQRLMGFSNATVTDPLTYNEDVRLQLEKSVRLNANHVLPGEKNLAGRFAGYFLRDEMEEFMACLDNRDWQDYGEALSETDAEGVFGGYVDFLVRLHEMPVVVSYGFSSARGTDDPAGPMHEAQQGKTIVGHYDAFMEAGCQGAVIATWQDNWSRSSWNTVFAVDETSQPNWLDVQTQNNGFGLLCFDTGAERSVCYVDGDMEEWSEADVVFSDGTRSLSLKYDEAFLYLMVHGDGYAAPLYLPVDLTPHSGSNYAADRTARFAKFADFLVEIDGANSARVLVQQRYDAAYMAYEKRISGKNAFYNVPDPQSSSFGPIRHVLKKRVDPDAGLVEMDVEERAVFNQYDVIETGELRHGNANPAADNFDSLADYCYGESCLELRIPWQLLNFSDPSGMQVHDDYYLHYGVEEMHIDGLSIGLGEQGSLGVIPMVWVELEGWGKKVEYHERLKDSYYIVQSAWAGGKP